MGCAYGKQAVRDGARHRGQAIDVAEVEVEAEIGCSSVERRIALGGAGFDASLAEVGHEMDVEAETAAQAVGYLPTARVPSEIESQEVAGAIGSCKGSGGCEIDSIGPLSRQTEAKASSVPSPAVIGVESFVAVRLVNAAAVLRAALSRALWPCVATASECWGCNQVALVQGVGGYVYNVVVRTSAQRGASSDAMVEIVLIGENGRATCVLNRRHSIFQDGPMRSGETMEATVRSEVLLGEVGAVIIFAHAEGPSAAAWLLHEVVGVSAFASLVRDPATTLDLDHAWCVAEITVAKRSPGVCDLVEPWHFAMHRWLCLREGTDVAVGFNQRAFLPIHTPEYLKQLRQMDLHTSTRLRWAPAYDGALPGLCIQPLPIEQAFTDAKADDFAYNTLDGRKLLMATKPLGKHVSFPSLASYRVLYDTHGVPWRFENDDWRRDEVWSAAFLNGPNAGTRYLRRIDHLPQELSHLDDAILAGREGAWHQYLEGTTLARELVEGRVFLADFGDLRGMALSPEDSRLFGGVYLAERALCLLRARPATAERPFALLPLCIVLEPERGADAPIFLPSDTAYEWLLARCHVGSAYANCHQVGTHFIYCHAAAEAFCVAAFNCLSHMHPLRRLLMPHLQFTPAINAAARASLINPAGVIEATFALGPHSVIFDRARADEWEKYIGQPIEADGVSFAAVMWQRWEGFCHLPRLLAKYGLDSPSLEIFPFRDDALSLWDAQAKWVDAYVSAYYTSDSDVREDVELAGFVRELLNALGNAPEAVLLEYREASGSRKALAQLLTCFIFQVSVMHASANFCQYEHYAFMPFMPTSMRRPVPSAKGACSTERDFLECLPTVHTSAILTAVLATLSSYAEGEVFALSDTLWNESPRVARPRYEYQSRLRGVSLAIQRRNVEMVSRGLRHFDYPYLDPRRLPRSVAI